MKITLIAAAALLALSGCATKAPVNRSLVSNTVEYAYKKEAGKAGVAQVFDLDGNTVIQMHHEASAGVSIVDETGAAVPFAQTGNYLVLKRQTHQFTVVSGNERATVSRNGKKPAVMAPHPLQAPIAGPLSSASTPNVHEYNIKTILGSLPDKDMADLATDIVQREKVVRAIEYLQGQLDELKAAIGMGKLASKKHENNAHKMRPIKKRSPAKKAKTVPELATYSCSDGAANSQLDENTVAKIRADVARGLAPRTCLDAIDKVSQAVINTTP